MSLSMIDEYRCLTLAHYWIYYWQFRGESKSWVNRFRLLRIPRTIKFERTSDIKISPNCHSWNVITYSRSVNDFDYRLTLHILLLRRYLHACMLRILRACPCFPLHGVLSFDGVPPLSCRASNGTRLYRSHGLLHLRGQATVRGSQCSSSQVVQ
jgi:hypothetical protein